MKKDTWSQASGLPAVQAQQRTSSCRELHNSQWTAHNDVGFKLGSEWEFTLRNVIDHVTLQVGRHHTYALCLTLTLLEHVCAIIS